MPWLADFCTSHAARYGVRRASLGAASKYEGKIFEVYAEVWIANQIVPSLVNGASRDSRDCAGGPSARPEIKEAFDIIP